MYTIFRANCDETEEILEVRVRRVVSRRRREGRRLPEFFLAPELVDSPPIHIDGFLVMGSRLMRPGELCVVAGLSEWPRVRFENTPKETM